MNSIKVPDYKFPRTNFRPRYNKPTEKTLVKFERDKLLKQIEQLDNDIKVMNYQRDSLKQQLALIDTKVKNKTVSPIMLYALKLENDCWYVGITHDVHKRFEQHCSGKGAYWTKSNKPIKIAEIRETGLYVQNSAAKLEDKMTLEYALKYGTAKVRGGGYCQAKPKWPQLINCN